MDFKNRHLFRATVAAIVAFAVGALWMHHHTWGSLCALLIPLVIYWQHKLYCRHERKVLFLLDAIENNDNTIHFNETEETADTRMVNRALNRVAEILYNVKNETAQREKYYELILDCVNTGIVVLNDNGMVYQKNGEALRLLGLNVFTHVNHLSRVDARLMTRLAHCKQGDKLQVAFHNERGTVNLSVRVSDITVHGEHLRILALNDINTELDEKEIDSWIRLTRVLTHEIMNAVTPITSLSDTLLGITAPLKAPLNPPKGGTYDSHSNISLPFGEVGGAIETIHSGLQTISTTGKGLLSFVESYRKFTRIPTPEPSLFYVKPFVERMIELSRHQFPDTQIEFRTDITPSDLILHADENLISQVLINLLKNAIQAQSSAIGIRAYCNEAEAVLIEVSNNGTPIPDEIADQIFIPFFTTKEGGSGVGLSISRQIMRLSGGNLSLLPNKATTFQLKFN